MHPLHFLLPNREMAAGKNERVLGRGCTTFLRLRRSEPRGKRRSARNRKRWQKNDPNRPIGPSTKPEPTGRNPSGRKRHEDSNILQASCRRQVPFPCSALSTGHWGPWTVS